jgi:hypothetical protein
MIDPTVNLYVIREADGFVSNLDCHNIKVFANNNKLFYISPFMSDGSRILDNGKIKDDSYAPYLNLYRIIFENGFFLRLSSNLSLSVRSKVC